jgi:hypothetical protein
MTGERAFAGCSAVDCTNIPASVTVLEIGCFADDRFPIVDYSLASVPFESE